MKSFGKYYVEAIVELLTEWDGLGRALKEVVQMVIAIIMIFLGILVRLALIAILPISGIMRALSNRKYDQWVKSLQRNEDF